MTDALMSHGVFDDQPTDLNMLSKDGALCEEIDRKKKEAGRYREQFHEGWEEQEKFYEGKHWKFSQKRPVKNWIFTIVEAIVPILTDTSPASAIIPYQEEDIEDAKILEQAMLYSYDKASLQLKISMSIRSALKTGTGWLYVDYDPDLEGGKGLPIVRNLNWRHVFIDPMANELDEAKYVILEIPTTVQELRRRFPKHKDKIRPISVEQPVNADVNNLDETKWHPGNVDAMVSRNAGKDTTVLQEAWLIDYSMEDIPEEETLEEIAKEAEEFRNAENPDVGKFEDHAAHLEAHEEFKFLLASEMFGQPAETITQEMIDEIKEGKMPAALTATVPPEEQEALNQLPEVQEQVQGMSVIFNIIDDHQEIHRIFLEQNPESKKPKYPNNIRLVMKNGKVILYDGPAPVEDGLIPVVPVYAYKTEDSIYGVGEVKNILSPQKTYNEMDYSEYKGLKLNTNSGWTIDEESGIDPTSLTSEEGLIVRKKQGTEAFRTPPGQVSPQLDNRKIRDREAIEGVSGVNEATQGRRPTGVTAAAAVAELRQQAVGRMRLKGRYLEEYSLLRLGKLFTSRIQKYWTTERKLRLYDKNGKIQFIKFEPDKIQDLEYEVKQIPGSTGGIDKESIFNVMSNLLQAGVIPPKVFFEVTDSIPNRNRILEVLEEQDEMQAQIQELAAQNEELQAQLEAAGQELAATPQPSPVQLPGEQF